MSACSMDLRRRVLADCDAGLPTKQVALKHSVSRTWVRWLKQRRRETGRIEPGRPTGRPRKIARMLPKDARNGGRGKSDSIRSGSF